MPRALRIVLTAVAIAALAVAVVLVVEGPGGTPPEAEGTGAASGNSVRAGSGNEANPPIEPETRSVRRGSGEGTEPEPADGTGEEPPTSVVLRRADPTPAYEGIVGPTVGRTPEQEARPFRVPHRADRGEDLALRDGEEEFFNSMNQAYNVIAASLADCAAGLPPDVQDTVFYAISVTDDFDNPQRGLPEIQHFASNILTGEREACARDAVSGFDFPPPWAGRAGEGPGFTSSADSRIQYDVEFEFEIGPE
jgi:hypothetical protein